jgi:hypothetical protein
VKLVGRDAVLDKLVYTATNPVQDHLVDRTHNWPGVNGLPALLAGRSLRATRPLHFFRRGARCARAIVARSPRRAASPGETCGLRSRPGASGRESRPCCVTAHSSTTTLAPERAGGTVLRSRFRPAPTGSAASRTCRSRRRERRPGFDAAWSTMGI